MARKGEIEKRNKPPWAGSGFYREIDIESLDARTYLGKSVQLLKSELRAYVGQSNAATELLISRITYKVIKLSLYEAACLQNPENREAPHYLPMANSLRLDLQALAGMAGQAKPPDLEDYLRGEYGKD